MYVELPRRNNLQQAVVGRRGYRPLLAQNAASLRAIPATREPVAARSFAFRATLVVPAGPREHRAAQTRTAAAETAPTANAQNAPLVARRWVTSAPAARSSSTLRGRASNLLTSRMAYISGGNQTDPDTRCRGPILLAGTAGSVCQNPNGEVRDATNMFTSVTPQPRSSNPNGFLALAVYDLPSEGGNNNGWIDPGDRVYSKLRVWIDANQDGEAQPEELHTLDELAIKRIGLRYRLAEKVDQYGNVFRYVSQVLDQSDARDYDVWIKLDPDKIKW